MTTQRALLRYVVLRHTGYGRAHFDLMFEREGKLMTWRSPRWPLETDTPLDKLADHRIAYLDYEGPISGGRGRVRRIVSGTFVPGRHANGISFVLDGMRELVFKHVEGNHWLAEVLQVA